jgi:hypothetical protein
MNTIPPPVILRDCVSAKFNREFFCIETYAHHRAQFRDPEGSQHFLPQDATDEALGAAVLDALAHSRFIPVEELHKWPSWNKPRYDAWVRQLMEHGGYKTKRALFKNMADCGIQRRGGEITISPSSHDKLEGWGGMPGAEVIIPATSSAQEIGAALRLAFSRCT